MVLVSRSQLNAVKAALDGVKSNAQALAAIDATNAAAARVRGFLLAEGGPLREGAAKDVADARKPVDALRKQMAGAPTEPVGKTWADGKAHVHRLWMTILLIESGLPPGEDLGDGWRDAVKASVAELPATIGKAVGVALKTAVNVVKPIVSAAAEISGSLVWGIVKTAWPVLLIAGIALAGYCYFRPSLQKLGVP